MKKEQLAFLAGGLAFGFLIGFGVFYVNYGAPDLAGAAVQSATARGATAGPAVSAPPPPMGGMPSSGGGAPMIAEINALKQRLQDNPQDLPALIRLGDIHYQVRMHEQAAGYYERAVQLRPDDPRLVRRLGDVYYDAQSWNEAVRYYERAAELDPGNADLLTDLGTSYKQQGRFDKALERFEQAYRSDPSHWQSLFNTVVVAGFDLRQFDRAEEALRVLEAMNPQPPQLSDLRHALANERAASAGAAAGGAS